MPLETTEPATRETLAADAAGLLLRIGFGLLVLLAPFAALFSRRAFVVLVPIGVLLIVVSALVRNGGDYFRRFGAALTTPLGLLAGGLAFWLALSLAWTPFPGPASERAFRTIGNAAMAAGVCLALPARMRSSNLHLMSLGIAFATLTLVLGAILGPNVLRFMTNPEAPTFGRAAVAAGVLVWPAVAWTMTRRHDLQGVLMIAACGVAALASGSISAAMVLVAALLVFIAARAAPERAAKVLGGFFAALLLAGPLLALAARGAARAMTLAPDHVLAQIGAWAGTITAAPARLITGHGYDVLQRARNAGMVEPQAPAGMIGEIWYDLGLPGAVLAAALIVFGFRALADGPRHVAAAALAATSSILVFLIVDPTSTQAWWLSVCVVAIIALAAVRNGQHRTQRPAAAARGPRFSVAD